MTFMFLKDSRAKFFHRLLCMNIAMILLLSPISACAFFSRDEPTIIGYSVNPTFGTAPIDVNIEVIASSAKQIRIETEQGRRLLGTESLSKDSNGNNIFNLKTSFSDGYEGTLHIYLKNKNGQWIRADEEFYVSYDASPRVTAAPTPEPDGFIYERNGDSTWAITGYTGNASDLRIPSEYQGQRVTTIAPYAFHQNQNLRSVTFSSNLKSIGYNAFDSCRSLNNLIFYNGPAVIDDQAFYGCSSLRRITLPEGVQTIGSMAFYSCNNLVQITLPRSVRSIGNNAFSNKHTEYHLSERREVSTPFQFHVPKNTYSADYVKNYHRYDTIYYYTSN